ncbi:liprin-beta-2 isoform X2 [Epinephelus fuscoguttatus]|uniref:liprin-beta-2 isoform X2 n=1 Tax=Epinephelus fuscoguttatus TaxID=293821 RepID=UPI0020D1E859|nr:liprin-beta-2 isoform X2 [Epinephelus fuscoguttatus]
MASNASHMLEAALEQMDDIIAGKMGEGLFGALMHSGGQDCQTSVCTSQLPVAPLQDPSLKALQLTEALRAVLEGQGSDEEQDSLRKQVSTETAHVILKWLERDEVNLHSSGNSESYQERLSRLEGDKESLILQVSVLTDQVEAQGAKISDLQSSLVEHQHKLNSTEEMLQQELLHRTSLESQKLNLMGEVSYLKLKLADMEGKQGHGAERQHKAETVVNFISELQEQMCRFQKEINSKIQEKKALEIPADGSSPVACPTESTEGEGPNPGPACDGTSGVIHKVEEVPDGPDGNTHGLEEGSSDAEQQYHCGEESGLLKELRILKDKVEHLEDQKIQYEKKLKATKAEISSLQQLLLSKNAEIESLHTQLLARPSISPESSERDQELQRLRSGMKSLVAANDEKDRRIEELTLLLNQCRQFREVNHTTRQAPSAVRSLSNGRTPSCSSEEEEHALMKNGDTSSAKSVDVKSEVSTSSSSSSQQTSLSSAQKDGDSRTEPQTLSSSMSDLTNGSLQKSGLDDTRSQTLPVNASLSEQNGSRDSSEIQSQRSPDGSEDGDSSQRKLEKVDDSTSSDNSPVHSGANTEPGQRAVGSPEYMKNNRSFKRLWGKLRRTQSGGLQAADPDGGQFKRGGLRATAGPRLTRTPESFNPTRDMNIPFSQWTKEQVCGWLEDYGLGQYVNLTRQWVESGQTLLSATPQDFEKEMGMKNPLHRKKLQLALKAFTTKVVEKSAELDHIWVTRWLDDIGLPQYKDHFHEARVDGRMIQYLTVNDLLTLKVTSQLHHLSIKCAIHVLHANKFNPNCLRRRPGEEKQPSPSEVVQWSNHRVMEWLRAVDLAEYAPNLRGSGVHGGLIILEPRFSSETLALLLNIPPQKTLLRRHLATAFSALVGNQATQEKREYGNATGHVPLTTTAKVKPKKLGFTQFSHLRKRRPDESADYICPIDSGTLTVNGVSRLPPAALRGLSPTLNRPTEKQEHVGVKAQANGPKHSPPLALTK